MIIIVQAVTQICIGYSIVSNIQLHFCLLNTIVNIYSGVVEEAYREYSLAQCIAS